MGINNDQNELIGRAERAEARVKELEAELASLRERRGEQNRNDDLHAQIDGFRAEIKEARAEIKTAKAENKQAIQELAQEYADLVGQLKDELEYINKLFANADLNPEQKLNLWALRQRHREER